MVATNYAKYTNPELHEIWRYDPETGKFTWKIRTTGGGRRIGIGDEAGTIRKDGYVQLSFHGVLYQAHMLAWVWHNGLPIYGQEVDHRNTVKNDNRLINLRVLGRSANNMNVNRLQKNNSTGHVGVYRKRGKWIAKIMVDRKDIGLGSYDTFEEAVEARRKAEAIYWELQSDEA